MGILPGSGFLSSSGGGGDKGGGGGSGSSGRSGSSGIFGGAFGIGNNRADQRHNEGSRTMQQRVSKADRMSGTKPNNDSRSKTNRSTGDRKEKEEKIKKGQEHKRSVTNKKDPKKLEKGETMIYNGSIVSRDAHGGYNVTHSDGVKEHFHAWTEYG